MNRDIFVQNVKDICKEQGQYPTVACRDSGVGASFINDIQRGKTPSVAKVQMLAQYLSVTTSYLLGEDAPVIETMSTAPSLPIHAETLLESYDSLNQEGQEKALEYIQDLVATGRYKKHSKSNMGEKHA